MVPFFYFFVLPLKLFYTILGDMSTKKGEGVKVFLLRMDFSGKELGGGAHIVSMGELNWRGET